MSKPIGIRTIKDYKEGFKIGTDDNYVEYKFDNQDIIPYVDLNFDTLEIMELCILSKCKRIGFTSPKVVKVTTVVKNQEESIYYHIPFLCGVDDKGSKLEAGGDFIVASRPPFGTGGF